MARPLHVLPPVVGSGPDVHWRAAPREPLLLIRSPTRTRARSTIALCLAAALLVPAGGVLGHGAARTAQAKDPVRRRGTAEPSEQQRQRRLRIRRGCDFLEGKQRDDGAFGDNRAVVALTALSVLALMAEGSTDGRGRHGKAVEDGLDFLIRLIERRTPGVRYHPGYFWHPHDSSSRMHGQGFATLALASALGTSTGKRAAQIRRVLMKAVACIETSQTGTGGFGYQPTRSAEHEGSVTVAVAQGLRAARDAGVLVDHNVVKRGLNYLKQSQKRDGSFQYSLHQDQSSYALTAAALSSFFLYGQYRDDRDHTFKRGIKYMRDQLRGRVDVSWYYYGHFYAAWACWQWDGHTWTPSSKHLWGWWHSRVYPDLFDRQRGDGSFEPVDGRYDYGPVLSTAFAVLTLAIPDELLPIFQR